MRLRRRFLLSLLVGLASVACSNQAEHSAERAVEHVNFLVAATVKDVAEVRGGLPEGAKRMAELWAGGSDAADDPQLAQRVLEKARGKVQDLRVAKSTFFAVADLEGRVVRSDQTQDLLVGSNIFEAFPQLRSTPSKGYLESLGDLEGARGVKGKPDGQWVAASAVKVDGEAKGIYLTGWAWSLYARRLHEALKSHIHGEDKEKRPLIYIFTIVGDQAFGRSEAPLVNSQAIEALDPLSKVQGDAVFKSQIEITRRDFGLAIRRAPALGDNVAIAVLRSEI